MSAAGDGSGDAGAEAIVVRRDPLGQLCNFLHLALMVYIVLGWLVPVSAALVFYLAFLPAVIVQWWFNRNACVLNNLEALIRTGRWRDPTNREEGAWLLTLARNTLGIPVTAAQVDAFTYAVLVLLWVLALLHFRGW